MRVHITRSAEQDLLAGFSFYEKRREGVGSYFLDSLYADIDSLALYQNPMDAYTGHLQGGFPSRSTMTGKAMK